MPAIIDPAASNPEAPATTDAPSHAIPDPATPLEGNAPTEPDANTPPATPSAPQEKNAWPGIERFVEDIRQDHAPAAASPTPPVTGDGPESRWTIPDHLDLPHLKGGYMAPRLISRAMDDLAVLTQGKRAGTPAEAREAFGQALLAENIAPRGYTAEDAVKWWQAGGAVALHQQTQLAMVHANYVSADDSEALLGPSNPPDDSAGDEAAPGMSTGSASTAASPDPLGGIDKRAQHDAPPRATTLADVLKDIDNNWDRPKPTAVRAPIKSDAGAGAATKAPAKATKARHSGNNDAPSIPADGQGAKFPRSWPVPIPASGVHFPLSGEHDAKGRRYSDGRYSPNGGFRGPGRGHHGDDVPSPLDTPVKASADGVVVMTSTQWARVLARDPKTKKPLIKKDKKGHLGPYTVQGHGPQMDGWGHFIEVRHPDGYITLYAHLREVPKIKIGTPVRLGQQIGVLGSTGNAQGRGSHVHLEVRDTSGHTYNPVDWMNGRLPPRKR